ncbi:MAG: hypothetical protein KAZ85_00665 [Gammaproteobacteria bacterium]|nr:hypothetical protein [Gammaproteobacteria bacterium]
MSTLEDKLAAGIAQVKSTTRTRKAPAKAAPKGSIPAALSANNLPSASATAQPEVTLAPVQTATSTPSPTQSVQPVVTEAPKAMPKRIYLSDDRVWPD